MGHDQEVAFSSWRLCLQYLGELKLYRNEDFGKAAHMLTQLFASAEHASAILNLPIAKVLPVEGVLPT